MFVCGGWGSYVMDQVFDWNIAICEYCSYQMFICFIYLSMSMFGHLKGLYFIS